MEERHLLLNCASLETCEACLKLDLRVAESIVCTELFPYVYVYLCGGEVFVWYGTDKICVSVGVGV